MSDDAIDVVIVLGVGLTPAGEATPTMRRRVQRGVDIFRHTGAQSLMLTGGPAGARRSEASVMRELALGLGVSDDRLTIEPDASTTFENAARSIILMKQRGWTRAIVVSDGIHLPRALLAFHSLGVRAIGRACRASWRGGPFRTPLHYALYEAAGLLWYVLLIVAGRRPRLPW